MEPAEYDNIARLEQQHWWYAGMRHIAAGWLKQVCPPAGAGSRRILDAGCGVGGGLRWLAAYGQVTGFDLHPLAIQYSARVSRSVCRASVQAVPFAAATFDVAASFEVLYHLAVSDDLAALIEVERVLRPGGWLLVRLPAHDWLRGAHDRYVHTRHRYEAAELREKLSAAGFEVRRLSSVGASLLLPAIVQRWARPSGDAHTDVSLPPPLANRLLLSALQLEGLWLRLFNLPAGLSVMALGQKPLL
jgi:SAM-dependent methyltransferase